MTSPVSSVAERLRAKAARFVKDERLPGAAVGVVHGNDLVWSAGIGFADVAARRAAETSTLYRIASITKTFTGTAIMQLRDEGLLDLDDRLAAHVPEVRDATGIETVTLRRLLSHESGLTSEPPGVDWTVPAYEGVVERNLERAREFGTRVPPNSQWKYSNLGYQLLGEVVARVSGTPYVDYVREQILDPLGMSLTAFEPLPDALEQRHATGYNASWYTDELDVAPAMPPVWAEGGLWSCVEDLARWISFQFREDGGARAGAQVLAGSTLREMHRPRYLVDEAWTEAWGISWYAVRRDDVIWVQHSGGLHGFISDACFDPREKVGAIALFNGIGDAPKLAMELGAIARTSVRDSAPAIEPPPATPEAYRALLGMYVSEMTAERLSIEWRASALTCLTPDDAHWRPTLSATEDPDAFVVGPGFRESGEPARFERLPDGRVRSVYLGGQTWWRLDRAQG